MSSLILLLGLLVFMGVSSKAPSARDQTRIVNGKESAQGKRPFFAGLFFNRTTDEVGPYCGGVVWDKDTVLTAAHCILSKLRTKPELFEVYLGHNDWTGQKDEAYLFKAKEIITHPDFSLEEYNNDIALIRLERSIDFDGANKKVKCVCDPEPPRLLNISMCVAMGWGRDAEAKRPNTLHEVVLPLLDNVICELSNEDFDPDFHYCAGKYKSYVYAGVCTGDSGGPLVCPLKTDPTKYSLVGLASYSYQPCGYDPDYYTKVENYLEWIRKLTVHEVRATTTEASWYKKWVVGETIHDEERK